MNRRVFVGIVAVCTSAATAAKSPTYDVMSFDVAGVRLGMTPQEARDGLNAKGFSVSDDQMSGSWRAQVAAEAGKYTNTPKDTTRAVFMTSAEGPEYQRVTVMYEVRPEGSRVRQVVYSRPADQGSLAPAVRAKYGPPSTERGSTYVYQSHEETRSIGFTSDAIGPTLEVYTGQYGGRSRIELSQGRRQKAQWERAFAEAVRALAPTYGKPSF